MSLNKTFGDAATTLGGRTIRLLNAEFLYAPRPTPGRSRTVFDFALESRLAALDPSHDSVLLIVNSNATVDSVKPLLERHPTLPITVQIANPTPWPDSGSDTPAQLGWRSPERWQRYCQSDRWARIDAALDAASRIDPNGYLIMPSHDAVWGRGLLPTLLATSVRHVRNGIPAAVSPYSYYRHSDVPGAAIPSDVIGVLNAALNRDVCFGWKLRRGKLQSFWGKTGLLPRPLCAPIRAKADQTFFEDDSEIDRAISTSGGNARAIWIRNPAVYRQALPIFSEADVRRVIERTLHYSLPVNGSALLTPPDEWEKLRRLIRPHYAGYAVRAEQLIAAAQRSIRARIDQFGASWIDWGAYRYVVRVGDPEVEVWRMGRYPHLTGRPNTEQSKFGANTHPPQIVSALPD
ncbi:MAG: hypothetical protein ACYDBJ_18560 [Aggregatilineales bacterium]